MKAKKLLALILSLVLICSLLGACSKADTDTKKDDAEKTDTKDDTPKKLDDVDISSKDDEVKVDDERELADTITLGLFQDLESFNPWLMAHDGRQQVIYNTVYEPLAQLNNDGVLELILAKSLEKNEDGTYSLEIWDNIYDTNGNQIKASDIVFSYEQCVATGQLAWGVRYLDHFDVLDDYHLTVHMKDESAVGLNMLMKTCHIVSEKSFNESSDGFATMPVGTGPYKLTEYTPGATATIVARDDYWQKDEAATSSFSKIGAIKTINFKIITDASQMALALQMGEVDCVAGNTSISTVDLPLFLDNDRNPLEGFNAQKYLKAVILQLEINSGELSPLQDVRLRQAVAYAIDTEAIIANIYGSDGAACTTNSSPFYADYDDSLNAEVSYKYNPDKAKELLKDAGYETGLELTLLVQTGDTNTKIATLVQSYLNAVGITVKVDNVEAALFTTNRLDPVGDKWDIVLNTVMSINTPGRFSTLDINAFTTGKNGVYVKDDKLQELFLKANLAESYSVETVTELLKYVDEQCYLYPIGYAYGYIIANDNFDYIAFDRNEALRYGSCVVYK